MHFMYEFSGTTKFLVYLKVPSVQHSPEKVIQKKFITAFTKNIEISFKKIASVSLTVEEC